MKYMKPEMEIQEIDVNNIIITSLGVDDVHKEDNGGPTYGWN